MREQKLEFKFEVYESIDELTFEDAGLLNNAKVISENAYAPYSNFRVGAVARLKNGKIVSGSNQENASFPVGLCAERVLLASVYSSNPGIPIETIAISYQGPHGSDHPVAPCGVCRQSLYEFELQLKQPVRLILSGMKGKVFILPSASLLLPLAFSSEELK
jgi:cytidine deaminase